MMRPSFSFPFVKPPNIIPCVDITILNEFGCRVIPCKPEAPWIKKCSFGIKFTEEIKTTIETIETDYLSVDQTPRVPTQGIHI